MTESNVSTADKEGDDNVNETDYMLKRDTNGNNSGGGVVENESILMR